jgi:hypothetical protein
MFLRIDKLQVAMPAPTEPDPNAPHPWRSGHRLA